MQVDRQTTVRPSSANYARSNIVPVEIDIEKFLWKFRFVDERVCEYEIVIFHKRMSADGDVIAWITKVTPSRKIYAVAVLTTIHGAEAWGNIK